MFSDIVDAKLALEATEHLIRFAHAGQYDRVGVPFWQHPIAVKQILEDAGFHDLYLLEEALLHDVVEKTFTDLFHNTLQSRPGFKYDTKRYVAIERIIAGLIAIKDSIDGDVDKLISQYVSPILTAMEYRYFRNFLYTKFLDKN